MSLSNERQSGWGTIFMGPGPSMETTLERVEAGGPSLAWTTGTESEYLDRVKEKATAKAKEILVIAQAEANALREQAHAQGYEAGLAEAQAELEEFRQGMGASVAAVLAAIEAGAGQITAAWRQELVELTRICVESAVNHELSEQRVALLAALFDGATAKMAAARRIAILVNPDDEPTVADMVDAAGYNDEQTFVVRGEASLEPGSLVLESDDSRVDNSLTVRRALVENILAQLAIPADTPAAAENFAAETPPAKEMPVVDVPQPEEMIQTEGEPRVDLSSQAEDAEILVAPLVAQDVSEMTQDNAVAPEAMPEFMAEVKPEAGPQGMSADPVEEAVEETLPALLPAELAATSAAMDEGAPAAEMDPFELAQSLLDQNQQ